MCGIAGFVINDGITLAEGEKRLQSMSDAIIHRGPDEEGNFHDETVFLAHRRLSIIDLKFGQQPMHSQCGKFVVVFNGEIYNFQEIRRELVGAGHGFVTNSDTEVLLAAYRQWGVRCVDKFIGMFAFALYDHGKDILFFARDRLGVKPFYYYEDKEFVFASEIKSIFASGFVSAGVDTSKIDFFMSTGYVPGSSTMFRGIQKLPPGSYGILRRGQRLEVVKYWSLDNIPPFTGTYSEAAEEFHALLEDSVRLRMISDVPVGVFLSGGVDSGAIVSTVCGVLNRKISTFSIGFADHQDVSELENAEKIASVYNTDHHPVLLTSDDFFQSLDALLYHVEEPLVEAAAIALMRLSLVARDRATVFLSGEGADEVFAGYPLYRLMQFTEKVRMFSPVSINRVAGLGFSEKIKKYLDWCSLPLAEKYQGISNDVTASIKRKLYHRNFEPHSEKTIQWYAERLSEGQYGKLQRMQNVDFSSWLPDDLLLKADKMTMAASIELRVPFLDHRLVEFGFSLPDKFKINGNVLKYILKKEMEGKLPDEILYQKKKGFPLPVKKWFRGELFEQIHAILTGTKAKNRGYFNNNYILSSLERHRQGKEDLSRRILSLLVLELWHQKYID